MRVQTQRFLQNVHKKLEIGLYGEVKLKNWGNKFCRNFVIDTKRASKAKLANCSSEPPCSSENFDCEKLM